MNTIKVIAFDFDGVFIIDSDAIYKKNGWQIALQSYQGRYEKYLEEGNTLFGSGKPGGRKEILRYVFEKLGKPVEEIDILVHKAAQVFDDYVQTKILEAGLVPGAMEILNKLSERGISLYLNSGTATSALTVSARNLKIDSFFKGIFGSTKEPIGGSKVTNLTYIRDHEKVDFSDILVVGDGDADIKTAKECNCPFIGVSNQWNEWDKKEKSFRLISNLQDLLKYITIEA